MKNAKILITCVAVGMLAGCAANPLKPPRPDGKRVPVNATPPTVALPYADTPARAKKAQGKPATASAKEKKGDRHG